MPTEGYHGVQQNQRLVREQHQIPVRRHKNFLSSEPRGGHSVARAALKAKCHRPTCYTRHSCQKCEQSLTIKFTIDNHRRKYHVIFPAKGRRQLCLAQPTTCFLYGDLLMHLPYWLIKIKHSAFSWLVIREVQKSISLQSWISLNNVEKWSLVILLISKLKIIGEAPSLDTNFEYNNHL